MTFERIEFLISQQADGTISADDAATLNAHLARHPDARLLVYEYEKLDSLLKSGPPVPAFDFSAMTDRINDAIDEQNAAPSYRLPFNLAWVGSAIAVAACAVIAVGLWMRPTRTAAPIPTVATTINHAPVQVAVLQPERLEIGPALQRITVGPPADSSRSSVISEAIVTRPNTLFIAKADAPAQDTPQSLY